MPDFRKFNEMISRLNISDTDCAKFTEEQLDNYLKNPGLPRNMYGIEPEERINIDMDNLLKCIEAEELNEASLDN